MGEAYQIRDQSEVYFLTFQVVGWADIFSRKVYRDIIIDSLHYCRKEKGLILFAYVIMTNHVHTIMQSRENDLSGLIRDFKKFTSKKILNEILENTEESRKEWLNMVFAFHAKHNKRAGNNQFWTHENHAIVLNTSVLIDGKMKYIHQNPVRAGWVEKEEDYLYSSARNYSDMWSLLEIDLI